MSGEEMHEKGADGARRAAIYLNATTRANVFWINPKGKSVAKLTFPWADGTSFSFDLGGVLLGGELEGQEFLAESKNYDSAHDQGVKYVQFAAQCYRAYTLRPERCDNFIWITWAPFLVTRWNELLTAPFVKSSVIEHRKKVFGIEDESHALELIEDEKLKEVSQRLRMLLLSEFNEKLIPQRKTLIEFINNAIEGGL